MEGTDFFARNEKCAFWGNNFLKDEPRRKQPFTAKPLQYLSDGATFACRGRVSRVGEGRYLLDGGDYALLASNCFKATLCGKTLDVSPQKVVAFALCNVPRGSVLHVETGKDGQVVVLKTK